MDIREELMTWCRGMERPGHEITHLGGTPTDDEKPNVFPYQYILGNINFSLQTATGGEEERENTILLLCQYIHKLLCIIYKAMTPLFSLPLPWLSITPVSSIWLHNFTY
jgi:hypothetical protein